ncbi:SDR family NAD(P)-dependent oxidoreductase [Coprobacter tertius]|uniref:SDR family oxidoreductase n=1 Tax=Coprobacter tertius TaxID=2944915 RepID=A0ABT1MJK9_9BACT|nr:SDR family oxidoreductase [Coprobacter tertius]MCP9612814.1 SDR family oxidoreductase [Coprobacter tertius]
MNNKPYVLVTGSSSGIGKSIAIQLSNEYNVVLHGRNRERLVDVREECNKNNRHFIWECDLNEIHSVEENLKNFLASNGIEISFYVHSAGFMKMLPLKMQSVDNLQMTFTTNVFSASLITKCLISKKINKNSLKSVVFISSNISNRGAKAFSSYAASKGALDSLMRCLAVELAPQVRLNSVLPGAVQTEMTKDIFNDKEVAERMSATYPLGIGYATDIADVVAFLLSDNARWITGQQLTVDGGRTIDITG